MYRLLRPLLFSIQPEKIHDIVVSILKILREIPLSGALIRSMFDYKAACLQRDVFGITFKNPVGLAAGFDKNGDIAEDLSNFGFGFIEIGSLTPDYQEGNPKPRCFRLPKDNAIINRMGINNLGVKHAISALKKQHPHCVIGGSITKGTNTPLDKSARDYELSFEYLYDFVDFIVLNVSCPNVKDTVKLQDAAHLSEIVDNLLELRRMYDEYRPILLKISPDISYTQLDEMVDTVLVSGLDGIIASNTTSGRGGLSTDKSEIEAIGNGGLSGAPLYRRTLDFVKYIAARTHGQLPIVASGGIMNPQQAKEILAAGASLVEIYSGFIYNGPGYVKKINKYLANNKNK